MCVKMADSSSEELYDESTWVFYKDRSDWEDVTPVPQDDGPYPIVAISYTEKFQDVYDYFRAVLKRNEKSERALLLTKDALNLNPANYTVWQYRRELLKSLNKDLIQELHYVKQVIDYNPKNYQVWHHRRVIVEWLQDPSYELPLTESVLIHDAKNYHAWQHRQWVIRHFNIFENELTYVERLLDEDIRNNSAWNQRYFVLNNTTLFPPEVLQREISYTLGKIKTVINNESAWNYLRGLLVHHEAGMSDAFEVEQFCEDLYASGNRSPYLLGFMVDMHEEQIEKGGGDTLKSLERAVQLCDSLAKEYDTIRREYWHYIARCLSKKIYGQKTGNSTPSGDSTHLVTELS